MAEKGQLGKRIKKVRVARKLTLKSIEATAGISATHLSEIERGKTSPTLGALIRIADALGKSPSYFVECEDLGDVSAVGMDDRIQEAIGHGAGTLERLTTSIPGGKLQACYFTLAPGGTHNSDGHFHSGDEAAIITSGSVEFRIDGSPYMLETGDSIHFKAQCDHGFRNGSQTEPAEMLWLSSRREVD